MNYTGMYLQEIRAHQAIAEIGCEAVVTVNHAEPKTWIDGVEYSLIFPKAMLKIKQPKTLELLFIGNITESRVNFLKQFPTAHLLHSMRGRDEATKVWDKQYFKLMASAKFVLCPDGDFAWTYRFFEAVIFGAIPVIETECDLYAGYKFLRPGDEMVFNPKWVKHNLLKIKKDMML